VAELESSLASTDEQLKVTQVALAAKEQAYDNLVGVWVYWSGVEGCEGMRAVQEAQRQEGHINIPLQPGSHASDVTDDTLVVRGDHQVLHQQHPIPIDGR
jgi:hypothetical protein